MAPEIGIIAPDGEAAIVVQQTLYGMGLTAQRFILGGHVPLCDAYIVVLDDTTPPTSMAVWLRSLRSPTILLTRYCADAYALHYSLPAVRVISSFRMAQQVIPQLLRIVVASQAGVYLWSRSHDLSSAYPPCH